VTASAAAVFELVKCARVFVCAEHTHTLLSTLLRPLNHHPTTPTPPTSLASIPGSSVEHNKFCVSAHFRNCHPDSWQRVVSAVESVVASTGGGRLHVTRGRKVLEVRPTVDWDKGSALLHLLEVLGLLGQPDVMAVYLGDDKTDEDAFAALSGAGAGAGVLVSTVAKPTAAAFTLRDPAEVLVLLQRLLTYGEGEGNGWRKFGGLCNGWAPAAGVVASAAQPGGEDEEGELAAGSGRGVEGQQQQQQQQLGSSGQQQQSQQQQRRAAVHNQQQHWQADGDPKPPRAAVADG